MNHIVTGFESFGVIPAAGVSARMGRHKLLLPYRGSTIIETLLDAWQASQVRKILIVARRDDAALLQLIVGHRAYQTDRLRLVTPEAAPADMKASVQLALREIMARYQPTASDAWLLAPADMPQLSATTIDEVLSHYTPTTPKITVGVRKGRNAHPVVFPWSLHEEVFQLADNEGVNMLVRRHALQKVALHSDDGLFDIDTPEDYRRLPP